MAWVDTLMERVLYAPLVAAALTCAACGGAFASGQTSHDYDCTGGTRLTAVFSPPSEQPGNVILTIAGGPGPLTLPQAMSADGGRYVGEGIEFWIKGDEATLTRDGGTETCKTE